LYGQTKLHWRHCERQLPPPTASAAFTSKTKKTTEKEERNSIALKARRAIATTSTSEGETKLHSPRSWETTSLHWFTPGKAKKTTLTLDRLGEAPPGGGWREATLPDTKTSNSNFTSLEKKRDPLNLKKYYSNIYIY
jgi:hypothetical protein